MQSWLNSSVLSCEAYLLEEHEKRQENPRPGKQATKLLSERGTYHMLEYDVSVAPI
jgi:hypothetical protein